MSHVTARLEMERLLGAIMLGHLVSARQDAPQKSDAA
jgi:hypothetical protein